MKKLPITERTIKLKKLLARYEELKCLKYEPFPYQIKMHQNQSKLRYARWSNRIGKSVLACRELVWTFRGVHPYREMKKKNRLTIWLVTETMNQCYEMYEKKLKEMLPEKEYRELRENSVFIGLEHLKTKSRIIFKAFAKGESRLQSATVDFMVIDEMPPTFEIFYELRKRLDGAFGFDGTGGHVLFSFTPLKTVPEIRNYIEGEDTDVFSSIVTRYECPMYTYEDIERERKRVPETVFRTSFLAEWASYEGSLIPSFTEDCIVKKADEFIIPNTWRSIMVVDPAASGYAGVIILSEDPKTGEWFSHSEMMIENIAPSRLIETCEKHCEDFRIVARYYDSHEAWFSKEALVTNVDYIAVRKTTIEAMTIDLDTSLLNGKIKIFESCEKLINQINGYVNKKETKDFKPVKGEFHILDSLKYGNMVLDTVPKDNDINNLPPLWRDIKKKYYNADRKKFCESI